MARGTTARMRRGSEATWQGRGWPTRGAGDARRGHVAKGHATTRGHVGAREGRHVEGGLAYGGPTGIVGRGKNLGAVTQMRYRAPIFNHGKFHYFLHVGLCPTRFLPFAGDVDPRRRWIQSERRKSRHVSVKKNVGPMIGHAFCSD